MCVHVRVSVSVSRQENQCTSFKTDTVRAAGIGIWPRSATTPPTPIVQHEVPARDYLPFIYRFGDHSFPRKLVQVPTPVTGEPMGHPSPRWLALGAAGAEAFAKIERE